MRTCRYCEAVDEAGGRKCRNCGAAYMDAPEPVRWEFVVETKPARPAEQRDGPG